MPGPICKIIICDLRAMMNLCDGLQAGAELLRADHPSEAAKLLERAQEIYGQAESLVALIEPLE